MCDLPAKAEAASANPVAVPMEYYDLIHNIQMLIGATDVLEF